MDSGSPRSILDRLLGMAVTICVIAVLLTVAVHLIESVAPGLLIILLIAGLVVGAAMYFRRRGNGYW